MKKYSIPNKTYQPDAKIYRNLGSTLHCVPNDMPDSKCSACGNVFQPDWLAEREPLTPVLANDGRLWVRQSLIIKCTSCSADIEHLLPIERQTARYGFFGDEAYRDSDKFIMVVYSAIGCNNVHIDEFCGKLESLKLALAPDFDPATWRFHMKELTSPEKRSKHSVFRNWKDSDVRRAESSLFDLLSSAPEYIIKSSCIGVIRSHSQPDKRRDLKEFLKRDVFKSLIFQLIEISTRHGVQPFFAFDAEKNIKNNSQIVQEWARNEFLGMHKTLLYSHLTRGITVPEPDFVRPGSNAMLELADFVAFVVSDYVSRVFDKKKTYYNPSRLGPCHYLGFDKNGNPVSTGTRHTGFPLDLFFQ